MYEYIYTKTLVLREQQQQQQSNLILRVHRVLKPQIYTYSSIAIMVHAGEQHIISDKDLMGGNVEAHAEVVHVVELTPEEKAIEKTLRRKIDARIMPLIILVYLMNYIDR